MREASFSKWTVAGSNVPSEDRACLGCRSLPAVSQPRSPPVNCVDPWCPWHTGSYALTAVFHSTAAGIIFSYLFNATHLQVPKPHWSGFTLLLALPSASGAEYKLPEFGTLIHQSPQAAGQIRDTEKAVSNMSEVGMCSKIAHCLLSKSDVEPQDIVFLTSYLVSRPACIHGQQSSRR